MIKCINVVILVFTLGLLVACGGADDSSDNSSAGTSSFVASSSVRSNLPGVAVSSIARSSVSSSSSSIARSSVSSSSSSNTVLMVGDAEQGARIFSTQCSSCHGDNGEGVGPFPSLLGSSCSTCGSISELRDKISVSMPNTLAPCTGTCALDVSTFIFERLRSASSDSGIACSGPDRQKPRALPVKRLSRLEYINTIADLFGFGLNKVRNMVSDFPGESGDGFQNNANSLLVSGIHVEQMEQIARSVADEAIKDMDKLVGCETSNLNRCANIFIRDFGKKVLRRPVKDEEKMLLRSVYDYGRENIDHETGIQLVVEHMLQMPAFLYRVEFGDRSTLSNGIVRLNPWEIASRLSYMFTTSTPDDELLEAATQGRLATNAQVQSQAERLLGTPKARKMVWNYFNQWMGLSQIDEIDRRARDYPGWTEDIPGLLQRETKAFVNHIFWDLDASLDEFLSADYTFANTELARFYGAPDPGQSTLAKVSLPDRNFGLLSQGSFLATYAREDETSPVLRGLFLLEKVLCFDVPIPLPGADVSPPADDPSLSTRGRIARKTEVPGCIDCHQFLNPAGYIFEHFDPSGRWREQDQGLAIDDSGEFRVTDIVGMHSGLSELTRALTVSEDVSMCAVKNWASYAIGRQFREDEDHCSLQQAHDSFKADGENLKKLLINLTQNDAFLYRPEVM